MSDPTGVVVQQCNYYLRIIVILQVCVKNALLEILHDQRFNGLPMNDEEETHCLLLAFKQNLKEKVRRVLGQIQWDIICHVCDVTCQPNCIRANKTNTQDIDITSIVYLIINYLQGIKPQTGWNLNSLAPNDYSEGASALRAREIRNKTSGHGSSHQITKKQDFDDCCKEIEQVLVGLKYSNIALFRDLKTASLEPYLQEQIEFNVFEIKLLKTKQDAMKTEQTDMKTEQNTMKTEQAAMKSNLNHLETTINFLMSVIEDLNKKLATPKMVDRHTLEGEIMYVNSNESEFKTVSKNLKRKYVCKYGNVRILLEPKRLRLGPVESIERKDIMVDLSLVPNKGVFIGITDKDEIVSLRRMQTADASSQFAYKDIIQSSNDYVIISGIPGCGKTTLVETILYKWSMGELWKDNFDFVFIIYFRQLIRFQSDESITCDKILSHFYPGDLRKLSQTNKSLLIMDGFDEFSDKKDFKNSPQKFSPFVQAVYDLVDPNNSSFPFTRIITSRPGSCQILFDTVFNESFEQNLRIFEIFGFNDINMRHYIHNHIQNTELAESLLLKISESIVLHSFMTIPFYCWGVCYLMNYKEITVEHIPVTETAIYAHLLTLFIRNHGLRKPTMRMKELFQDEGFQNIVLTLSKMAYKLKKKNKLMFTKTNLEEMGNIDVLMKSGLVLKVESESEDYYQFLHYSFQEFLCSLYLYYGEGTRFGYLIRRFEKLKIICGLCGGKENGTSDEIVQNFARMKESTWNKLELKSLLRDYSEKLIYNHLVQIVSEFGNPLHLDYLVMNYKFFDPPTTLLDYFEKQIEDTRFSIKNLVLRVQDNSSKLGRTYTALYPLVISSKTIIIYDEEFLHFNKMLDEIQERLSIQCRRLTALDVIKSDDAAESSIFTSQSSFVALISTSSVFENLKLFLNMEEFIKLSDMLKNDLQSAPRRPSWELRFNAETFDVEIFKKSVGCFKDVDIVLYWCDWEENEKFYKRKSNEVATDLQMWHQTVTCSTLRNIKIGRWKPSQNKSTSFQWLEKLKL